MRIRVPHRILLMGVVLALLCALPAVTPSSSVAKPYNWDPTPIGDNPTPTSGDGDGGIVKARYIGGTTYSTTTKTSAVSVTSTRTWSILRTYLSLVRLGYWVRWTL
jgi:hypothetical protein